MRAFRDHINGLYRSERGRFAVAALLSALCIGLTLALCNVTFLTNDDTNIMYVLAGYRTGAYFMAHRFIHFLLAWAVSFLYSILPAVPWWAVVQLMMLWLAFALIGKSFLDVSQRAELRLFVPMALMLLLYLTVVVYTVLWIAFTMTAAMLGAAVATLLIAADPNRALPVRTAVGAAVLMVLCFLFRNASGIGMLPFIAAALTYRALACFQLTSGARNKRFLRQAGYAAALMLLVGLTVWSNNWGIRNLNPKEFAAFDEARGMYMDFPHPTYEEAPALYRSLGWDETIYNLAERIGFVDEHVTAEAMRTIAETPVGDTRSLPQKLLDTLTFGMWFFRTSGVSEYTLVIPVAAFLWSMAFYLRRRWGNREAFIHCALAAGAFLLCLYLCYTGRFLVRTFQLIAIPTTTMGMVLCLQLRGMNGPRERGARKSKAVWAALLTALTVLAVGWSLVKTAGVVNRYDQSAIIAENAAAERYVIAHPDNVYITDPYTINNLNAWTVYPHDKPTNLLDWGGTSMHSAWQRQQLAVNGLDQLSAELFTRENVYFLTVRDGEDLATLMAYLEQHAGAVGYEQTDAVTERIAVYRILFS